MTKRMRIGLTMGLSFGALMTGIFVAQHGVLPGLLGGTIAGVLFGAAMGACYGRLYARDQKLGDVRQQIKVRLSIGKKEAFEACKASLKRVNRRVKVTKENMEGGQIHARASMTWDRTADVIRFRIEELGTESSEVEIESHPWIPTVINDQGSNLKNIKVIEAHFLRHGLLADDK